MCKGTGRTTDWDFYLQDVYLHFANEGGRDVALSRCLLKLNTAHFIAMSDNALAAHSKSGKRAPKGKGRSSAHTSLLSSELIEL